jgi:hypothetical protein
MEISTAHWQTLAGDVVATTEQARPSSNNKRYFKLCRVTYEVAISSLRRPANSS